MVQCRFFFRKDFHVFMYLLIRLYRNAFNVEKRLHYGQCSSYTFTKVIETPSGKKELIDIQSVNNDMKF